jgi:acyl carrier protein
MKHDDLRQTVLRVLGEIAPEADLERLQPNVAFRQQLDLDSMDFLNFVIALHEATQVEIPERDYSRLASLDGCVEYLAQRLSARQQ